MSKFSTAGKEGQEQAPSKWIQAPCVAEATIVSAKYIESSRKGTPGLEIVHMTEEVPGLSHEYGSGQIAKTTFWLSEKAFDRSQNSIILLCSRLGKKAELDAATATATTEEEFANGAAKVLEGAHGAFIFSGEEVWLGNDDGTYNLWMKPVMNTTGSFVRTIDKKSDLLERFEKRGAGAFIKQSEKPAETTSDVEDSEW